MKVIKKPAKLAKELLKIKKRKTIGLVPTMGYLHSGHLKLVKTAKKKVDVVVVSLFINPTQFGKNEDFGRYPRDEKGDLAKLKAAGVDYIFMPGTDDMYPQGFQTEVEVCDVSRGLCGDSRPGHFKGVATVVLKLLNIVQPDVAVFGRKDYQQLQVIRTMVRDLNLPVKVIGVETVREKDGLALSSRNAYLTPSDRQLAFGISQGLKAAKLALGRGVNSADKLKGAFKAKLPASERVVLDYIECVDAETLAPVKTCRPKNTVMATAVFVGGTRLIDNMVL